MPYSFPTQSEFDSLAARVTALESAANPTTAPPAPTNLTAQWNGAMDIVEWDPVPGIDYYKIYCRQPQDTQWQSYGTAHPPHAGFGAYPEDPPGTWEYHVTAVSYTTGESEPSATITLTH